MSQEVTMFSQPGLPGFPADKAAGALRALAAARVQGGKIFLNFNKQGQWVFGPEQIEVAPDEEWAVNPMSVQIGVIAWSGGTVVGEQMFSIYSPQRVDHDALPHVTIVKDGDGWKDQWTFDLKSMKDGTEVLFKTSSRGGMDAVGSLSNLIGERMGSHPESPVAICNLLSESYKHKTYGKIFKPMFRVAGWANMMGERVGDDGKPIAKRRALV